METNAEPRRSLDFEIVEKLGSLSSAVRIFVDLDRLLFQEYLRNDAFDLKQRVQFLLAGGRLKSLSTRIADCCEAPDKFSAREWLRRPFALAEKLLPSFRSSDIRFFAASNIRELYRCNVMQDFVGPLREISNDVNRFIIEHQARNANRVSCDVDELFLSWKACLAKGIPAERVPKGIDIPSLYFEAARFVGYFSLGYKNSQVFIDTAESDIDFILCSLFGIQTNIPGFDELFGGGLILANKLPRQRGVTPGRAILIKGRFGTGKTTLALQLCAEVTRKGGRSRYVALEQSPNDCRYLLDSFGAFDNAPNAVVCSTPKEIANFMSSQTHQRQSGLLAILDGAKQSNEEFLDGLESDSKVLGASGLRLIAIDPVNSVHREITPATVSELRGRFFDVVTRLKREGINILFVAEASTDRSNETLFEENVVDTVIHLSDEHFHGFAMRNIEIQKSRLQREHRGTHKYAVVAGEGFRIFPSPSAVDEKLRHRRLLRPDSKSEFGFPVLDRILGKNSVMRGDVLAFQGNIGSFKTQLGILFLLNSDLGQQNRTNLQPKSLLVAARESEESLQYQLRSPWVAEYVNSRHRSPNRVYKAPDDIVICSLPQGHIHPGMVLQEIENKFIETRKAGGLIDRVMITNIAHWEFSCPLIRQDTTFPDTLVNLMRRYGKTCLFVCGAVREWMEFDVQRPIIDCADTKLFFEQFDFQGERRVSLRVTKTRSMEHISQKFEIGIFGNRLSIRKTGGLLRVDSAGRSSALPIRLFLHAESAEQAKYNNRWRAAISTTLSDRVHIESQSEVYRGGALRLANASSIDELHIFQMDEFQVPRIEPHEKRNVSRLDTDSIAGIAFLDECEVRDSVRDERQQRRSDNHQFLASLCVGLTHRRKWLGFPYYADFGVLLARSDSDVDDVTASSWSRLADRADEHRLSNPENVFFDFPKASDENFNCLFLEILGALLLENLSDATQEPPRRVESELVSLLAGKSDDPFKLLKNAAELYWRLGHAAFQRKLRATEIGQSPEYCSVDANAVVWRHWLSTAQQMLQSIELDQRGSIELRMLPKRAAVAGDWYLCVPSHSSELDVAYEILRHALSKQSSMERLHRGVGLPVLREFYEDRQDSSAVSRDQHTDLIMFGDLQLRQNEARQQIDSAIRRSFLTGYRIWSGGLASSLRSLLSIPGPINDRWRNKRDEIVSMVHQDIYHVAFGESAQK